MRVLILGATGMLGHMACRVLAREHTVHATCRGSFDAAAALDGVIARERCVERFDPTSAPALASLLALVRPHAVLNAIGAIKQKPDGRDPRLAIRINALLPHELAAACEALGAKLITVGTDCVFSGRRGGYDEADVPDPVDLYGRSKLLGEVVAAPHLTLRTSLIGRQLEGSEGLFEWLRAQRGGRVRGFARAIFSGVTTAVFCRALAAILAAPAGLNGLYHLASAPISKLELLRRIDRCMDLRIEIEEDHSVVCDRSLDGTRLEHETGFRVPQWDEMLAELVADATNHDGRHHGT